VEARHHAQRALQGRGRLEVHDALHDKGHWPGCAARVHVPVETHLMRGAIICNQAQSRRNQDVSKTSQWRPTCTSPGSDHAGCDAFCGGLKCARSVVTYSLRVP